RGRRDAHPADRGPGRRHAGRSRRLAGGGAAPAARGARGDNLAAVFTTGVPRAVLLLRWHEVLTTIPETVVPGARVSDLVDVATAHVGLVGLLRSAANIGT